MAKMAMAAITANNPAPNDFLGMDNPLPLTMLRSFSAHNCGTQIKASATLFVDGRRKYEK
jgi:hypothetical protein